MRFGRPALAAVLLAVGVAALGCSSGGPGSSLTVATGTGSVGSSGVTSLESALARVSDTPGDRAEVFYDNTAELVSLAGKSISAQGKGYGQLRGWGITELAGNVMSLQGDTGIDLFNESYAISAGAPPEQVSLLAGGQDAAQVTTEMTKLGWKKGAGGALTGPAPSAAGSQAGAFADPLGQVQVENSDVLAGWPKAALGQIGSPSGTTLAGDPGIKALASCLGNVVAATMASGSAAHVTAAPTEIATGITQPASASAKPQMVSCVSWPTQQEADTYAANLTKALTSGTSPITMQPYSAMLSDPKVTNVGGAEHIVEWQANASDPSLLTQMTGSPGLPALPNCSAIANAPAQPTIGC